MFKDHCDLSVFSIFFLKSSLLRAPGDFSPSRAKCGCPGLVFSRPGCREAAPGAKIIVPGKIQPSRGNFVFPD